MQKDKSCKMLQNKILPTFSKKLWAVLAISIFLPFVGWIADKQYISLGINLICLKTRVLLFYNYLLTFSTVIAAVVVLYYTIQDNHREGAAHRKVVAYIFGSGFIPALLLAENVGILLLVLYQCDTSWMYCGMIISVLVLQCSIFLVIILSATSFFGQYSIRHTELKQFGFLMEYQITDRKYVWNYLAQHMVQAAAGDDMIFDKAILIRMLLDVPNQYKAQRLKKNRNAVVVEKWRGVAYEYYYLNLLLVLEQFSNRQESLNQIFLTLYEFLDMQEKKYQESGGSEKLDYLVTASAVLNAVLVSGIPKAEEFCNHVLNECIQNQDLRTFQIFSYILFLCHLFLTEPNKVQMKRVFQIRGIREVQFTADEVYGWLWMIWSAQSDISFESSIESLGNALTGLQGRKGISSVVDYFYITRVR